MQEFTMGSAAPSGESSNRSFTSSIERLARRLRANILRRRSGIIYELDVAGRDPAAVDDARGFRVRQLSTAEIEQTTAWNASREMVGHRLDAGDECFGIVSKGEVIYLHWWTNHSCLVRGADLLFTLAPTDRYFYNIVVRSDFRNQGVYRSAESQIVSIAAEHGIKRLVAFVEIDNLVSQHITERMKLRTLGLKIGSHYDASSGKCRRLVTNGMTRKEYWI
jgi:RimJ/RimL family protein N-acetyltransferase